MSTSTCVASRMQRIDHDGAGERREATAHQREHRIAGDELERRMGRIDLPRSGERDRSSPA